jgi:metal-responsive CopG/Arc/MetJ family transcriptional regulator
MTTQTSVHLPDELLAELVRRAPDLNERSNIIVEALRYFFSTHQGSCEELDRINAISDELNQEAEDVLDYQVMS